MIAEIEAPGNYPAYPREDKCRICGDHIGWITSEIGEGVALGDCGSRDKVHTKERRKESC